MNLAYIGSIVAYAISIKRVSILFTVIYGALALKEKNPRHRIAGAAVMVVGTILILLG